MKDATNQLHGYVSSVTNENSLMLWYKSQSIRFFVVKMGSGVNFYSGCYHSPCQLTTSLVNTAHANGILIFGYNFPYGTNVTGEVAMADYVFNTGADGFIWDAESSWESLPNKESLAWQQCSMVRSNWPNKFLAHAPSAIVYFHTSFPRKEFGYWSDTVMPQIYHYGQFVELEGSMSAHINWADVNWKKFHDNLASLAPTNINGLTVYWTNAIKPIAPLNNVYGPNVSVPPGTSQCNGLASKFPDDDVLEFIDYLSADPQPASPGGYNGVSFWRTDLHSPGQWANIKLATSGAQTNVVRNIVFDDNRATFTGSWTKVRVFFVNYNDPTTPHYEGATGSDTNSFGTNYWVRTQGTGSAYAQFTPNILTAGDYDIYQWHVYRADASTSVPFIINHNGGSTTVNVNQTTKDGKWSLVGRFPFAVGTSGYIRITDGVVGSTNVALVDGLKLIFVPATSVPATPTSLMATGVNSAQINLTWTDNATNETAYIVARSTTNGGPYTNIATLGVNATNFSNTGLAASTTYYYVVRATNSLGASANSAQANATTVSATVPVIITQPQGQTVSATSNATFSVIVAGAAPLFYKWRFNGTSLAPATNSSYTRTNAQVSDEGSYAVVVTNSFGGVTSSVATLTVVDSPLITTQPQSRSVVAGSNVTFSVTASGSSLAYQWRKNGSALADGGNVFDATTATLTLSGVTQTDTATYTVVITNFAGSVTSAVATLTVFDAPTITVQPASKTGFTGDDATFTVTAMGTSPFYQWRFNGAPISGATASSYTRSSAQASDAGSYSVVVSNLAGSVTSANAILTVNAAPLAFDPFADATPSGTSYTVNSNLADQFSSGATWVLVGSNNGTNSSQPTIATGNLAYTDLPPSAGNSVSFTNLTGTNGQTARVGLGLSDSPTLVCYSFILRITDLSAVSASAANNYIAAFSDTTGGQAGTLQRASSRLVTKKSGTGYVLGIGKSASTSDTVYDTTVHELNEVLFIVASWERPTAGVTNCNLWINPSPSIGSTTPPAATVSNTIVVTGNNPLNNNGARAFVISCQSSTAPGGIIDELRVTTTWPYVVGGAPTILQQPISQVSTSGTAVTFTVAARGTAPLSYRWKQNGAAISSANASGTTTPTLVITNVSQSNAGSYTVTVTNSLSIATSDEALLTVLDPPIITSQPVSVTTNGDSTAVFDVTATGTQPLNFQWSKNGIPLSDDESTEGSTTPTLILTSVSLDDAGLYSVSISNVVGSLISSNAVLTVRVPPTISAAAVMNGVFHFNVSGPPGPNYGIDASTNLTDWVTLALLTNSSGTIQFTDQLSPNFPQRYYRASVPK